MQRVVKVRNEVILDVGCGARKVTGAIGVDRFSLPGVDVVHDLDIYPWPFANESFDRIVFCHSASHLQDIAKTLKECYRLLRPGGIIEIIAPHYSSDNFNTDPTHRIHLGYRSMNYFVCNVSFGYRYIDSNIEFELQKVALSFRECKASWRRSTKLNPFAWIGIESLVNIFPRVYERFFCWIVPASEVYFRLGKLRYRALE